MATIISEVKTKVRPAQVKETGGNGGRSSNNKTAITERPKVMPAPQKNPKQQ